jgi:cytochrome c oxidase subunit 4
MTLAEYRRKRGEPILPEDHDDSHEGHPSAWEYTQIGLFLAVITAIEVALYYIDLDHTLLVAILLVLSVVKFSVVVLWFMHLKFDSRLFSTLFVTGLLLAMTVFAVVIAILHGGLV